MLCSSVEVAFLSTQPRTWSRSWVFSTSVPSLFPRRSSHMRADEDHSQSCREEPWVLPSLWLSRPLLGTSGVLWKPVWELLDWRLPDGQETVTVSCMRRHVLDAWESAGPHAHCRTVLNTQSAWCCTVAQKPDRCPQPRLASSSFLWHPALPLVPSQLPLRQALGLRPRQESREDDSLLRSTAP